LYRRAIASKMTSRGRRERIVDTKEIKLVQGTHIQTQAEAKAAEKDANTQSHEVEDGSTIGTAKRSGETAGAEREIDKGDLEDRAKDGE